MQLSNEKMFNLHFSSKIFLKTQEKTLYNVWVVYFSNM